MESVIVIFGSDFSEFWDLLASAFVYSPSSISSSSGASEAVPAAVPSPEDGPTGSAVSAVPEISSPAEVPC